MLGVFCWTVFAKERGFKERWETVGGGISLLSFLLTRLRGGCGVCGVCGGCGGCGVCWWVVCVLVGVARPVEMACVLGWEKDSGN